MLSVLVFSFVVISASYAGEYCLDSDSVFLTSYCDGYCCGTYETDCCQSTLTVGQIIGIVIGCIMAIVLIVIIIVCIVQACNKSGSRGRVVQPQPNTAVFIAAGPPPYGSHPPGPPPYTRGPAYPYPGPSPQPYPPPGQYGLQTNQQPGAYTPYPGHSAGPATGPPPGSGNGPSPSEPHPDQVFAAPHGAAPEPVHPQATNTTA